MKANIAIIAVSFCCHCLFGQSFAHIGRQQADAEILSFLDSMQITSYMLGVFQDTVPPTGVSGLDGIWDGKGYLYFVKENTPPYTGRYLYLIVGEDGGLRRFYGTGPSLAGNWRLFTTDKPFSEEDLFDLGGISRPALSGDMAGERNYAILINGGKNDRENHPRYWNNCAAVYSVLTGIYGFDKNNIYVLMSDGTSPGNDTYEIVGDPEAGRFGSSCRPCSSDPDLDGDGVDDVRFSATKENITLVFDNLSEKMTEDDNLFIFTTDHGGVDSVNDTYVLSLWNGTTADSEFFPGR